MDRKKILIVEDEAIIAEDIALTVREGGYEVCGIVNSVNKALLMVDQQSPYLVIVDIFLKGELTGIDLAHALNQRGIPFIFLSANCNPAVLALAKTTYPFGFIVKPFREKDLLTTLDIASYHFENKVQMRATSRTKSKPPVKAYLSPAATDGFEGIVGKAACMLELLDLVRQVAPLDTSVLILGESGTGKEAIATNIHSLSGRKGKPFVKINCAALPLHLIESELFGHERGAFTGAYETRIGKFERAHGGTIFLDEIGEMSVDTQVKLLRVLQERSIERIGGNETIKVDVRIVAATNRNLDTMITDGRFRLDLYYRLNVFPLQVPPLRERLGDIPLLAEHFSEIYAAKMGKAKPSIAAVAIQELLSYPWPGNIRELQNAMERTVLLNQLSVIEKIRMPAIANHALPGRSSELMVASIEDVERDHILKVLKQCNNKINGPNGAAQMLNLPPSTLYSKIKKLGLTKREYGAAPGFGLGTQI